MELSPRCLDWFYQALEICYTRPASVWRRMNSFRDARGHDAFLRKLAKRPEFFGSIRKNKFERSRGRGAKALLTLLAHQSFGEIREPLGAGESQRVEHDFEVATESTWGDTPWLGYSECTSEPCVDENWPCAGGS
jgi:hypothetical protein